MTEEEAQDTSYGWSGEHNAYLDKIADEMNTAILDIWGDMEGVYTIKKTGVRVTKKWLEDKRYFGCTWKEIADILQISPSYLHHIRQEVFYGE